MPNNSVTSDIRFVTYYYSILDPLTWIFAYYFLGFMALFRSTRFGINTVVVSLVHLAAWFDRNDFCFRSSAEFYFNVFTLGLFSCYRYSFAVDGCSLLMSVLFLVPFFHRRNLFLSELKGIKFDR